MNTRKHENKEPVIAPSHPCSPDLGSIMVSKDKGDSVNCKSDLASI